MTILKQKARKVMKEWIGMVSFYLITLVRKLSANEAGLSTRWNVGADDAITRHRTKSSDKPDRRRTMCRSRRGFSCSLLTPSKIQMKLVRCLAVNVPVAVLYAYTMYQDDHNNIAFFCLCTLMCCEPCPAAVRLKLRYVRVKLQYYVNQTSGQRGVFW